MLLLKKKDLLMILHALTCGKQGNSSILRTATLFEILVILGS